MKIERLVSIIMILLQRKKIRAPELAKMFEVNLRTIYRDIETINQAGIPIITFRGPNGGIGIMEEYKIEKKLFTLSDITELLIGLKSIHSTMSSQELLNTIAKIKGLVSKDEIQQVEEKTNQIKFDHTPWFANERIKLSLEKIKTAINENKFISFKYFDRLGQKSKRKIESYRLVLKNSSWYIQGYCTMREDFRIFEVSNMSSLEVLEETFMTRDFDYDSQDIYFRTDRETITLKLLIHESLLDIMVEFCGKNNVTLYKDNKYIAYLPFVEDDYFYNMILRFGDKCECLEPEHVRIEIIRKIEKLLSIYKKTT
ncbi:helix-turn-helix transcriptional regulator [Clostridium akagii]|uniref:helix-turn-helix transcriptional regulator n=1 Tax=Clostridium akagii TaxID=91623 RepID=UPI00047B4B1E|nr:YafY family protein [Clostridium akagii]